MMMVKNIKLIQSKDELVAMLEKNLKCLVNPADYVFKEVEAIKSVELPDLDGIWEYTAKLNLPENAVDIVAQQVFWNDDLQCYDFKNEKVVSTVSLG